MVKGDMAICFLNYVARYYKPAKGDVLPEFFLKESESMLKNRGPKTQKRS
jgi:hypothetical protein